MKRFVISLLVPIFCFAVTESERNTVGSRSMSADATIELQIEKERAPLDEEKERPVLKQHYWGSLPAVYYPNSIHWIVAVSALGDQVEFQDGSVWKVDGDDAYKILNWRSEDPILLTQNNRWFSRYEYRMINKSTGTSAQTNLFLGPVKNGENTFYLISMDPSKGEAMLNDNSRWEICSRDKSVFSDWAPNDAIIIGYNSGWSSDYESLLINVNMNNFVRARQF